MTGRVNISITMGGILISPIIISKNRIYKGDKTVFYFSKSTYKKDYFLKTVSYEGEAKGWIDNVYLPRREMLSLCEEIKTEDGITAINSRVWTETEETGFGVYQYEETSEIQIPLLNENYKVSITFVNPAATPYEACVKANGMVKTENITIGENAAASESTTVSFSIAITNGILGLRILPAFTQTKREDTIVQTVFIKDITVVKEEKKEKGDLPAIYLASDSTVQTYDSTYAPQTGWGEVLIDEFVTEGEEYQLSSLKIYETKEIRIINRAIGGRSSKSFMAEGRLDEILTSVKPGDFVFVQFGHNDATAARPNRYVPSNEFGNYLMPYINGVRQRKATCVLVTPVARRNYNKETGEFSISFNSYRKVMIELSEKYNIPLLDLGKHSTEYLNTIGEEESKSLFMWIKEGEYPESNFKNGATDDTHLQRKGAKIFAGIVADLIRNYEKDNQLDVIKDILS